MIKNRYTNQRLLSAEGFPTEKAWTKVRLPLGVNFLAGQVLAYIAGAAATEVKTVTISGSPTGGTFTVTFDGTSFTLAYNVSAAVFQAALETIFGVGNVTVSGPSSGVYTITFAGALANTRIASFTVAHALTGGSSPSVATANTTRGSCGPRQADAYDDAQSDGRQIAKGLLAESYSPDFLGGNEANEQGSTGQAEGVTMFTGGYFKVSDTTGLDAAAVADLGRLAGGTAITEAGAVLFLNG